MLAEAAHRVAARYPGLYGHQRTGITFLLARQRAILADDMGMGKSRQAIVALRESAPDGNLLIVCPASVKLNWRREIRLIEPDATVDVIDGGSKPAAIGRWTVVNYDLLGRGAAWVGQATWAGAIVDEAHYIKNDSQRTKHVLRLLGIGDGLPADAGPDVVYLLTGTPMSSRPRDLFNLLKAVRHPLAASFYSYAVRYCAATRNDFGLDSNGASNLEELAEIVSGVLLRRTKDEALDLPPKVRTWQPVTISSPQVGTLEARALDYLNENPARSGPTWVQFLGLLNRARHELALAKIPATIAAVRERLDADEKVVVFTGYTGVVSAVMEALGSAAVSITGSDSAAARQQATDALQTDPSVRVLVGNLHAAGVGITLTAATHVIFNDLDWVPGNHWQAEDRIYRIGQTRPAFVTYLYVPETLDDFVAALLEAKARNIGILETAAAEHASVLQDAVESMIRGDRPAEIGVRSDPVLPTSARSVGLLDEALDLLARARRGLGSVQGAARTFQVPSKSKPGTFNVVTVTNGVPVCECSGFLYRGNCSHSRSIARELSRNRGD